MQIEQEECNLINRDGSFDSKCFISNYIKAGHLTKETPPPIPNKYFDNYWISIENETYKLNKLLLGQKKI